MAAAIKMYFLELDPLAIHIVSSAAHNILADMLNHRGKDASIHGIVYGLLRAARDLKEGQIQEAEIRAWGDEALPLVQQYGRLFEENPDFNFDEVSSASPAGFAKTFWSERRRSYNYLKHADRDANDLLDEAQINNEDTILQAMMCFQHLNMKHTPEKHFFVCAMIALGKIRGNGQKPFDLELLMSDISKAEIMALGRGNLCGANYPEDEFNRECASEKMAENAKRLDGKEVRFFSFD